ncbi:hypothetical protein GCM10027610_113560 [Dactylosporangium cerinum]
MAGAISVGCRTFRRCRQSLTLRIEVAETRKLVGEVVLFWRSREQRSPASGLGTAIGMISDLNPWGESARHWGGPYQREGGSPDRL